MEKEERKQSPCGAAASYFGFQFNEIILRHTGSYSNIAAIKNKPLEVIQW
jgi:hypothetical protein